MSEYRIRSTGEIKSQGAIRKSMPNTSLPRVWTAAICDSLGIDPVLEAPQPAHDELETVVRNGVTQDAKGNWVQAWEIKSMFSDYTYTNDAGEEVTVTKAEQEAEYTARIAEEKATAIRTERDKLLAETDWMVIKAAETGVALAAEWATYRQALRDVTAQTTFPNEVTWPNKPE